jgi:hypothetical protein
MEKCPENKPICLKISTKRVERPEEKMIQKKCDGTDYVPIDALETLLKYAPKENTESEDFDPKEKGHEQHCYFFETAWLIVIKDIEKRIDLMKKVDVAQLLQNPEFKTQMESVIKRRLDIKELFEKIIEVGEQKWETNKDKESLAYAILTNMKTLVKSEGFGNFSKQTLNYTSNLENSQSIDKAITQEIQEDVLDKIKTLFKMTYAIMNDKEDLTNMEYKSVADINAYFKDMEIIFKMFKPSKKNTTVKGGRKKKNKTKKGGYRTILATGNRFGDFMYQATEVPLLGYIPMIISIAILAAEFAVHLVTKPFRMGFNVVHRKYKTAKFIKEQKRLREQAIREEAAAERRRVERIDRERRELLEQDLHGLRPGPTYKPFASSPRSSQKSLPPSYEAPPYHNFDQQIEGNVNSVVDSNRSLDSGSY